MQEGKKQKERVVYSYILPSIHPLRLQSLQVSLAYFLQILRHLSEAIVKKKEMGFM